MRQLAVPCSSLKDPSLTARNEINFDLHLFSNVAKLPMNWRDCIIHEQGSGRISSMYWKNVLSYEVLNVEDCITETKLFSIIPRRSNGEKVVAAIDNFACG